MHFDDKSINAFDNLLLTAACHGDVDQLGNHLAAVSNPNSYLNRLYDGINSQKCTVLMTACLNGHTEIVRILLDRYKPDLEVLNNVIFGDVSSSRQIFYNVSVLWVATSINNLDIVKLLVKHGADVNHRTKTGSTPLRGACYNGNVDMARFLIDHGADVHLTKENHDTNLMVSVCHKHLNIVTYLIDELHCDVNECDYYGRSSLYDAVTCGSLELVEFLLKRGARNLCSLIDKMSPLMWAAERKRPDLVDVISPYCSMIERIEAQELLGSAFVCVNRVDNAIEKSFEYYCRALELRKLHNLSKCINSTTNAIFGNRHECQTIEELEKIRLNTSQMHIEALLVRERLLGPTNGEYRYSLCYRGAILADDGQYHEAMAYWIYELQLCQQYSIPIDPKHLRRFASLLSGMLYKLKMISVDGLVTVIKATVDQLDIDNNYSDENLLTLLFLITIMSQHLEENGIPIVECKSFYCILRSICCRSYTKSDSRMSLLHIALDSRTSVNDYHIKRICKYPCLQTTRLLLQCGTSINALDTLRNTPLHIFAANKSSTDKSILKLLCDAGAHLDYSNALGQTPFDLAKTPETKQLLQSRMKLNLKCLCARLIKKNNIPFHDQITVSLGNFVEKH